MTRFLAGLISATFFAGTAQAQIGGLLKNAEPYWSIEGAIGSDYAEGDTAGELRLAWGNDFEDTSWELGLSLLNERDAGTDPSFIFDATYISHFTFPEVVVSAGLGIELFLSDYAKSDAFEGGLVGTLMLSLPDRGQGYDPYVLLRGRLNTWSIGAGVRYYY